MTRITWWPVGHHHLPKDNPLTQDEQMTFQQALDLAEFEADLADEQYFEAFETNQHPERIEQLRNEATLSRHKYYAALNADLAL
jgi:uncharacterized membrane protein YgaE (UPF0421/DUF939 family)